MRVRASRSVVTRRLLAASLSLLLVMAMAGWAFAAEPAAAVSPIGKFGNMKFSGEHCSGYELDLWRDGPAVLGLITYCAGLVETRASGALEDQKFDPAGGELAFSARLTVGMDYLPQGETSSKDFWSFRGKLAAKEISGGLKKVDRNYPARAPQQLRLTLRKSKEKLSAFKSRDEWTRWAAEKLEQHGPKW